MDKQTLLKVWNALYWISIVGISVTLLSICIFSLYGMKTNMYLWGGVAFYFVSAIYAVIMTYTVKTSDDK